MAVTPQTIRFVEVTVAFGKRYTVRASTEQEPTGPPPFEADNRSGRGVLLEVLRKTADAFASSRPAREIVLFVDENNQIVEEPTRSGNHEGVTKKKPRRRKEQ